MYHWVHLPNSGALELLRWLEIAQMVGVDLYAPYQKGGMSLLRDVLRRINNPSGPDYLTLRLKFIVLAKTGLCPTDESSGKDLLDFLKAQRTEAEVRNEESVEPGPTDYLGRCRWRRQQCRNMYASEFLSQAIKAVEYHQEHNKHWPNLEIALPI